MHLINTKIQHYFWSDDDGVDDDDDGYVRLPSLVMIMHSIDKERKTRREIFCSPFL